MDDQQTAPADIQETDNLTEAVPKPKKARLFGLDFTRAVAIFGMVIVNVSLSVTLETGVEFETNFWTVVLNLLSGRAAATFVILAGIGAALGSSRARASGDKAQIKHARLTLVKRALILLVIGYAWLWLWTGDILHFYGIYLLFGAALLTVRDRYLWLVLVGSVLVGLLFLIFGDYAAGWSDDGSYGLFSSPWAIPRELFLNGLHPVFPWVGFYILGMLLGRSNLRNQRNLLIIAVVAGAIALVAELVGLFTVGKFGWSIELADTGALGLLSAAPLPPTPIYLLAAGGTAVALISTLLLVINRFPSSRVVRLGAYTGQMALTVYVVHVLFVVFPLAIILELLEVDAAVRLPIAFGVAAGFMVVVVVFSFFWWHLLRRRGPLEALLRRISG